MRQAECAAPAASQFGPDLWIALHLPQNGDESIAAQLLGAGASRAAVNAAGEDCEAVARRSGAHGLLSLLSAARHVHADGHSPPSATATRSARRVEKSPGVLAALQPLHAKQPPAPLH